jgi:Cytochrome P450
MLMTFTLAMIENPRVWKHAQANIDAIIGLNSLPDLADRPNLPYIDAVLRETMRWAPSGTLGACSEPSILFRSIIDFLKVLVFPMRPQLAICTRITTFRKVCLLHGQLAHPKE